MNVLGIDPGKSGGLAVVQSKTNQIPKIIKAISLEEVLGLLRVCVK